MNSVDPVDPVDAVDALVGELGLRPSGLRRRDVVLVTGPWLSGVTGVADALRTRLPGQVVVESTDLGAGEAPRVVVFVVSAAAVLTESDVALLEAAAAHTDAVVCAVSKIDVHRGWREVLAADIEVLAGHAPRYRDVRWVGVAAAPRRGEPVRDELVAAVRELVGDDDLARRNQLRMWESRLSAAVDRYEHDVAGAGRQTRVSALREQRESLLRQGRLAKTEHGVALRNQLQQARVQLGYFARNRCTTLRGELQEDAAAMTRRRLPAFEGHVGGRVAEVVAEVDRGCTERLSELARPLAAALPAPGPTPEVSVPHPALGRHRLENRLMMLLGTGFGLGVALTVSRLLADLAPAFRVVGVVCCVVAGLALSGWVVATRRLLRERAVLDRWVGEVTASLQAAVEQRVATRVLTAEPWLAAASGRRDAADAERIAAQVAVMDGELREHATAAARAVSERDRQAPALREALERVRAELR